MCGNIQALVLPYAAKPRLMFLLLVPSWLLQSCDRLSPLNRLV